MDQIRDMPALIDKILGNPEGLQHFLAAHKRIGAHVLALVTGCVHD